MKQYITPNTLANTVRMTARSRRPKAVFLASDQEFIGLMKEALPGGGLQDYRRTKPRECSPGV